MTTLKDFWERIDESLDRIAVEGKTVEDVIRILNEYDSPSSGDAFFGGSGGDRQLLDALLDAGWRPVWVEAEYYFAVKEPHSDAGLTYIEGDVERGIQEEPK